MTTEGTMITEIQENSLEFGGMIRVSVLGPDYYLEGAEILTVTFISTSCLIGWLWGLKTWKEVEYSLPHGMCLPYMQGLAKVGL